MIGAMFWTINADAADKFSFFNRIGPQVHAYPPETLAREKE